MWCCCAHKEGVYHFVVNHASTILLERRAKKCAFLSSNSVSYLDTLISATMHIWHRLALLYMHFAFCFVHGVVG